MIISAGLKSANAQVLPPIRRPESFPTPYPIEPEQAPLQVPESFPNRENIEIQSLFLKSVSFIDNNVFTSQELQPLVSEYLNRNLTLKEIRELRDKITKFYVDKGYINSGAAIQISDNPTLNLEAADLKIRVIEGKLSELNIYGSKSLSSYAKKRIEQKGTFNINRLYKALLLLQDDEMISEIKGRLELVDPSLINLAKLDVNIKPSNSFNVGFIADNYRNPGIGSFERGIDLTSRNFLSIGDKFNFSYRNTDGSNYIYTSFGAPITRHDTKLSFSYLNSSNYIVEKPFKEFNIRNTAQIYSLSLQQPIQRLATEKYRSELGVIFSIDHLESQDKILDFGFPISKGADDSGLTKTTAFRFGQYWRYVDTNESLFLKSQISIGLDIGSITGPDFSKGRFLAWRGDAYWARKLPLRLTLITRAGIQVADRSLISSEQFSLGGIDTVRGYRQDGILEDNGFFSSLELRIPVLKGKYGQLSFSPFFDVGIPWGNAIKSESPLVASSGVSVQYNFSDQISANFTWGIPLFDVNGARKSLQEQGLLFSLKWSLF